MNDIESYIRIVFGDMFGYICQKDCKLQQSLIFQNNLKSEIEHS